MNIFETLFLGLFQGVTEFLPISSSGHLTLAEYFFHFQSDNLYLLNAVLHGGTLLSLLLLFRSDIFALFKTVLTPHKATLTEKNQLFFLVLATIPVGIVGFFWEDFFTGFRSLFALAFFFALSGLSFFLAEFLGDQKTKTPLSTKRAIGIGLAQIVALFPGISRSGTTTAAGILCGLPRGEATRFSFFLGLPTVGAAFLLSVVKLYQQPETLDIAFLPLFVGFFTAALSGFFVAKFLLRFFQSHSLRGFGMYLLVLSLILLFISV